MSFQSGNVNVALELIQLLLYVWTGKEKCTIITFAGKTEMYFISESPNTVYRVYRM